MFFKKIYVLLIVLLNISVTVSLRFFQSRKRKKQCLVREEWNFHHVTCTSKYQKCCATGCCDSAINNAAATYVKVGIVCSVIAVIFLFIYMELWCKKKCTNIKKKCHNCRKIPDNDLKQSQELQSFPVADENKSKIIWDLNEITKSDDGEDEETLSSVYCDSNQK